MVIDGLNGCHVYYNHARKTYILTRRDGVHTVNGFETSITASELDGIVTEHLLFWLEFSRMKPSHNAGYAAMDKIKKAQPTGTVSDDLALANVKLAKVERALRTSEDVMDDDELRETYASKAGLIKRVSELEAIRDNADRQAKKRARAKEDIETAHSKWAGWSIEERRSFIRLVTDSVTLEEIASGWLRITITWSALMGWFANKGIKNPDAYFMQAVGYIWRQSGGVWSDDELDILRTSYPTMPRMELLRLLPSRSWLSVMTRAARLEPHVTRINTSRDPLLMPDDTSITDEQVISEFMLDRKRIQWHTDLLPNASNLSR